MLYNMYHNTHVWLHKRIRIEYFSTTIYSILKLGTNSNDCLLEAFNEVLRVMNVN